jgi:ABC-type antimicrobial peptide transport system permease subunit
VLLLWRKFKRKPLRIFLTFLQVLLGSLAMTLALSPYFTPRDTSAEDTFFLNSGFIDKKEGSILYGLFETKDFEALKTLAPEVEDIAIYQPGWNSSEIVFEGKRFAFKFLGTATVDLHYFAMSPVTITRGHAFSGADATNQEAVVLVSDAAAKKIFGDAEPIGQTLLKVPSRNFYERDNAGADPVPYRVVGTFADETNILNTTPGIFFPIWSPESFYGNTESYQILVKAKAGRGEQAKEQLLAAARQHYKSNPDVQSAAPGKDFFISKVADFNNIEAPFNPNLIILGLFGVISLIIGSIGMFSTTLVEVLERSYDIGIKRALGASSLTICKEFSVETALLALLGSLSGALLAALLITLLAAPLGETFFYGLQFTWQPLAALLVSAITVLLGAVLGFFPAFRATRMKPIEAIRGV